MPNNISNDDSVYALIERNTPEKYIEKTNKKNTEKKNNKNMEKNNNKTNTNLFFLKIRPPN